MPDATLRSLIAEYITDLPDDERQTLIAEISATRKEKSMSLDATFAEIDGLRAKAAELNETYARTQAGIAADEGLTETGKADALEPLHEQLRTQVAALHAQEKTTLKSKRESLEKVVHGTSSADIAGYRRAQIEAARIVSEQEADTLYASAVRSNDKVFAQAIFSQALDRGWGDICTDYKQRNPAAGAALDDLERLRRYERNGQSGLKSAMHYMTPGLTTDKPVTPVAISTGEMRSFFSGGRR